MMTVASSRYLLWILEELLELLYKRFAYILMSLHNCFRKIGCFTTLSNLPEHPIQQNLKAYEYFVI